MTHFVYEYETTITNPSILVDGDPTATALNLVAVSFRSQAKIDEHRAIGISYQDGGHQVGIFRTLEGNVLCTKRVFNTEQAARSAKHEYDVIYADNAAFRASTGVTGLSFADAIYEITAEQFQALVDGTSHTHF